MSSHLTPSMAVSHRRRAAQEQHMEWCSGMKVIRETEILSDWKYKPKLEAMRCLGRLDISRKVREIQNKTDSDVIA